MSAWRGAPGLSVAGLNGLWFLDRIDPLRVREAAERALGEAW